MRDENKILLKNFGKFENPHTWKYIPGLFFLQKKNLMKYMRYGDMRIEGLF